MENLLHALLDAQLGMFRWVLRNVEATTFFHILRHDEANLL
jgi:hypothetical protein